MNQAQNINNLLAWSVQVGLLVAIAGLGAALFRLRVPKAKLLYWQFTVAACLALPFLRPWKQEMVVLTHTFVAPVTAVAATAAMPSASVPVGTLVLYLIALVSIARMGWLAAGLIRMHSYRRRSVLLPRQPQWGVEAELRVSNDVTGPVTFGFIDPVILLPADFPQMNEAHRQAILCHEFLHVRRCDWLFTVGEELIRTALWFHPAIWWVLGEIQLAREEAVDQEAIGITRSREHYVDALLAIAGAAPRPDLAAASPFLRRRHLRQRIVSIFKETRMSRTKALSALAASLVLVAASCWLVAAAIPLYGAPQVLSDSPGVAVDIAGASLLHRNPVLYPAEALSKRIEGTVIVLARLDDKANVADASVVSGPDELRKAVLQSVLNWHFTRDMAGSTRQIAVSFRLSGESAPLATLAGPGIRAVALLRTASPEPSRQLPAGPQTGTLAKILIQGLGDAQRDELAALLPVHEGDPYTPDLIGKVAPVVNSFDEHLRVSVGRQSATEFLLVISAPEFAPGQFVPVPPLPPPPPPPPPPVASLHSARIGAAVMQSKLLSQPMPVYPPLAKAARVQGTVRFEVLLDVDGHVQNLQLVSGPPLLVAAAMTAVQQWVYAPTLLNGNPTEVSTTVDVNFTLADQ